MLPLRYTRRLPALLLFAAAVTLVPVWAQQTREAAVDPDDESVTRVVEALEDGDADALLEESGDPLELVVFDRSGLFSRRQAALVLQGFFRRHPPRRVVFAEQSLTDEERAAMGRYWTRSGEPPLQVYLRFRPEGEAWSLDAVRIERTSFGVTSSGEMH